jgi:hypothetical protein
MQWFKRLTLCLSGVALGTWIGMAQQCLTCQATADVVNCGKHSGTNGCFEAACSINGQLVDAQCLTETCNKCGTCSGGTAHVCPASHCGENIAVLCQNINGC